MRQYIKQLLGRVDGLSLRERVILFAGILVVLFVLWDTIFMSPVSLREKNTQQQIDALHTQINTLNDAIRQLTASRITDPNAELRVKLAAMQASNAKLELQLNGATAGLVPPEQMAGLLRQVLAHQHGLRLISVKNLPPQPLLSNAHSAAAEPAATEGAGGLYRHSLEIVFEGDYPEVVAYLQALEHLRWRFYWDGLDLEVQHYPVNRVTIRVHTLSLHEGYIGV